MNVDWMRVADIAADGIKEFVKLFPDPTVDKVARVAWLIWSQFDPSPTAYALPIDLTDEEAEHVTKTVEAMRAACDGTDCDC
jgi:hypothetical protein